MTAPPSLGHQVAATTSSSRAVLDSGDGDLPGLRQGTAGRFPFLLILRGRALGRSGWLTDEVACVRSTGWSTGSTRHGSPALIGFESERS